MKRGFIKLIVYAAIIYFVAEFIKWDASVQPMGLRFSESSYTEYMDSFFLLCCSSIYLYMFLKLKAFKPLSLPLFAFCFASLIREQDAFLDEHVFFKSWQVAVLLLLIIVAYYSFKHRKTLLQNIDLYTNSLAFGVFLSGFLTTYVFSRLYGRTTFWKVVMEDKFFRTVKTASEECIELFGYSILLLAAFEFFFFVRRNLTENKSNILE